MLKKLLEPFVWVIGVAAGVVFLWCVVNYIGFLFLLAEDRLKYGVFATMLLANLFGLVWVIAYFGVRGFPAARTLSRGFWLSWLVVGVADAEEAGAFGIYVLKAMYYGFGTVLLVVYAVLVLLTNLYVAAKVYRYSRIAKAAKIAGDKKPFAGWNTKAMKTVAGLISLVVVGVLVCIVMLQKHL